MYLHFLPKIIEQMEEATVQIDKNTATGSRLALILIDNAIEISMWEKINSERPFEDFESIFNDTFVDPYSDFNKKTNFLVSSSIITHDTKKIFDICHHFRNEVYHTTITKDSIINDLAKIYLEACCRVIFELFSHWSHITIHKGEHKAEILNKYGIKNDPMWPKREKIDEIVNIFLKNRLCNHHQFYRTLSADITKRIYNVRNDIEYIKSFDYMSLEIIEKEKRTLKSLSYRADKLNQAPNVSSALTRYFGIDKDLISIESRMAFISDVLSSQ